MSARPPAAKGAGAAARGTPPSPAAPRRPAPRLPAIAADRCTGCGRCVAVCEPRVLSLESAPGWRKSAVLHRADGCTGCSLCAVRCPFGAITMRRPGDAGA